MTRRKKHMRLPNGYGSIKYLGKGRRNPYGVYPPVTEYTDTGAAVQPKALCYTSSWTTGFAVLTAYKAGTYYQGMELDLQSLPDGQTGDLLASAILADYGRLTRAQRGLEGEKGKTFAEVYDEFFREKYESGKKYSQTSIKATRAAYKNSSALHGREFRSLRHDDLQAVVDSCPLKHASLELIVSLFHQMYAYADARDLCDKDYSAHIRIKKEEDDEHGVPFSDTDLAVLWEHQADPTVEMILIMCYSGFRISAYQSLQVHLAEGYFQGGVKTASSKDRIVPIHPAICPLVERRLRDGGQLLPSAQRFRVEMDAVLADLGLKRHTPHDCRHTFSRLCEKYGVSDNDRKRMLGHSFGADITNGIYGHRSLEDLQAEIEKIQVPEFVTSLLLTEPD
ncbi:MAG: integrase [Lachnospiraceae bacterium]|nr:integrase [Lachnospiraceae bacterium]